MLSSEIYGAPGFDSDVTESSEALAETNLDMKPSQHLRARHTFSRARRRTASTSCGPELNAVHSLCRHCPGRSNNQVSCYLDICVGLTGQRTSSRGSHSTGNCGARKFTSKFLLPVRPVRMTPSFPLSGYMVGNIAAGRISSVIGPDKTTE